VIRFANVLLDLDGTLTDPFDGIAASICYAMERMGFEAPPEEELRAAKRGHADSDRIQLRVGFCAGPVR
jgi:phosphoglycolate phosphatase-like HAD superfamily hydrolase